jgi:hypothetical protein
MSTGSVRQSAQIIQFPARGRNALVPNRQPTTADLEKQAAGVAVSDAWYHAEAILDAKRIGER